MQLAGYPSSIMKRVNRSKQRKRLIRGGGGDHREVNIIVDGEGLDSVQEPEEHQEE